MYGNDIQYEIELIKPDDYNKIQAFSCGNMKMDHFYHEELIHHGIVDTDDGLPFKVINIDNGDIIGVFSLAASAILIQVDKYTHMLPAIKIDTFAIDMNYQKLHMDEYSKSSINSDDHFYLSDSIMCDVIKKCRDISEQYATVKYIILFADKKAKRFYERNFFLDFDDFMYQESNMEIIANDAMYLELE